MIEVARTLVNRESVRVATCETSMMRARSRWIGTPFGVRSKPALATTIIRKKTGNGSKGGRRVR